MGIFCEFITTGGLDLAEADSPPTNEFTSETMLASAVFAPKRVEEVTRTEITNTKNILRNSKTYLINFLSNNIIILLRILQYFSRVNSRNKTYFYNKQMALQSHISSFSRLGMSKGYQSQK
jgi:hypothetical protein